MIKNNNQPVQISLNGGVLIIGSLLWDVDEIRKQWRNNFLDMKRKLPVAAPIRYGRVSSERKCTFTMVFSAECLAENMQGSGIFVPFANNPVNLDQLTIQAKELIKSERKAKTLPNERYNWSWGALALAINPSLLAETSSKSKDIALLKAAWAKNYGNGFSPEEYKIADETPIVTKQGMLLYNWPKELVDFDFILVTCTKTERDSYPTAKNIAERMLVNEYKDYFRKNRALDITTFQDTEIMNLLKDQD